MIADTNMRTVGILEGADDALLRGIDIANSLYSEGIAPEEVWCDEAAWSDVLCVARLMRFRVEDGPGVIVWPYWGRSIMFRHARNLVIA
jgi:hypothetical protein